MQKNKVFTIAEIGINHNGSFENCLRLIDAVAAAGADAAKFQLFRARYLYPRSAGELDWKDAKKKYSYNIYSAAERCELATSWIPKLMKYCRSCGVEFLTSVSDPWGLDFMVGLGLKKIKITSYSITNIPLIEKAAVYKLPIILSTGGAMLNEVFDAVAIINKFHNNLSLLHCSIQYPTALRDCNLGVIETLRYAFPENTIGYSDHTKEVSIAPVQAVYLGARIIEKHITLNKSLPGPDHFFALTPCELKRMVADIHSAEKDAVGGKTRINKTLYGSCKKIVYSHEVYMRNFCYSTIFAGRDIKKGERICHRDLKILRIGKKKAGLEPKYLELFRNYRIHASRDIGFEEPISWEAVFHA
ncbi:MAG: N-acetylneuraminate synthase family protein [Candidatus Omnitrophica bacterium]|nr:N-acetylneuraminate synthase family protein [Candidatus Omnitrophota bacterium]